MLSEVKVSAEVKVLKETESVTNWAWSVSLKVDELPVKQDESSGTELWCVSTESIWKDLRRHFRVWDDAIDISSFTFTDEND